MFMHVARLRLSFFLSSLFLLSARADDGVLFTSSVTYCQPPEALLVQQFDIAYFASNQSVVFNISAASVSADVNVTANILLNVYGMQPLNLSIDLCSLLGGALCPLPEYNFQGSDSITLPASLGISNRLPGIAFKIPDLEAVAQLTLVEVGTNQVKACVEATLSNGWSAHQTAVVWTTRGLALLVFVISICISLAPTALLPFRFLELIYLFQSIAFTGILALNFSSVYRAFTLNFAWALGLFPNPGIQQSINNMRVLTGGNMANSSADSAVGLVNRALSPYNFPSSASLVTLPESFLGLLSSPSQLFTVLDSDSATSDAAFPSAGSVQTITSSNTLQAGLPIYANSLHIATANAFMTMFIFMLIILAIVAGLFITCYIALRATAKYNKGDQRYIRECIIRYPGFARAWMLRLCLIFLLPVTLLAFYQWTLKDSWLSVLLSVITILSVVAYLGFSVFLIIRTVRQSSKDDLYSDSVVMTIHGPLYIQYRTPRYFFSMIIVVASLLKSIIGAFLQEHGKTQVALLIVVEAVVFLSCPTLKPHHGRGADVLSTYLSLTRLVCTGLIMAFAESLAVAAIPRVVIGIVAAIIFSVSVIVLFINLVLHCGGYALWRLAASRRRHSTSTEKSATSTVGQAGNLEKSSQTHTSPISSILGMDTCGAENSSAA